MTTKKPQNIDKWKKTKKENEIFLEGYDQGRKDEREHSTHDCKTCEWLENEGRIEAEEQARKNLLRTIEICKQEVKQARAEALDEVAKLHWNSVDALYEKCLVIPLDKFLALKSKTEAIK